MVWAAALQAPISTSGTTANRVQRMLDLGIHILRSQTCKHHPGLFKLLKTILDSAELHILQQPVLRAESETLNPQA